MPTGLLVMLLAWSLIRLVIWLLRTSASITSVTGMHLFIGTIPEGFRPSQIIPLPAVFVPTSTTDYEPRLVVVNPDGTIMIAKNPTVTGTFFLCNGLFCLIY